MMKLDTRDHWIIGVGAVVVLIGAYVLMDRMGQPGTDSAGMQPEYEDAPLRGVPFQSNNLGLDEMGNLSHISKMLHMWHPDGKFNPENFADMPQAVARHRYPVHAGSNISALMHKGYSALAVETPRDYNWLTNPPTESQFGSTD